MSDLKDIKLRAHGITQSYILKSTTTKKNDKWLIRYLVKGIRLCWIRYLSEPLMLSYNL